MQPSRRVRDREGLRPFIRAQAGALCLFALAVVAGCGDDPAQPAPPPAVDSPAAVVDALADAYRTREFARFDRLIAQEPGARFAFYLADSLADGTTHWDPESELYVHRRMFTAGASAPQAPWRSRSEPAVPPELWLSGITISLGPVAPFAEVANPAELDPARWRLFEATYQAEILFGTQGAMDYRVSEHVEFAVIEDLSKSTSDAGKFLLYSCREQVLPSAAPDDAERPAGVEQVLWGQFLTLYAPTSAPGTLIDALAEAYQRRDYQGFIQLFPKQDDQAPYLFFFPAPLESGETHWGQAEEIRIHRRMFRPDQLVAGEPPVPQDLWLSSITITLIPMENFTERRDLYRSPANPNGLDPHRWRTFEAPYHGDVLFDTQNDRDFRIDCRENFIVADRRDRLDGVPGNYVLYRWEDLGSYSPIILSVASWTMIKDLYRR